jgi:hypothetical protein
MNGSGLVCLERHPLGYQATSQRYCSLTKYGGSTWRTYNTTLLMGPEMDNTETNLEKESSAVWDSNKGSVQRLQAGQLNGAQLSKERVRLL